MNEIANKLKELTGLVQNMTKYLNVLQDGIVDIKDGIKNIFFGVQQMTSSKNLKYTLYNDDLFEEPYYSLTGSTYSGYANDSLLVVSSNIDKIPVKAISLFTTEGDQILSLSVERFYIPETVEVLKTQAFHKCRIESDLVLPKSIKIIQSNAFSAKNAYSQRICDKLYILSKAEDISISPTAFQIPQIAPNEIYVPWGEGEVEGAPWGATNSTIIYNYNYEGDEH